MQKRVAWKSLFALFLLVLAMLFAACSSLPALREPESLSGLDESDTGGENNRMEDSGEPNGDEDGEVTSRLPEGARPNPGSPAGEILMIDGVPQNSLISVTITDEAPTVHSDCLHRRIKNESSFYLYILGAETLQRLVGEKWETVASAMHIEPVRFIMTLDGEFPEFYLQEYDGLLPGDYRIITDVGYDFYIVSYFTLTE